MVGAHHTVMALDLADPALTQGGPTMGAYIIQTVHLAATTLRSQEVLADKAHPMTCALTHCTSHARP